MFKNRKTYFTGVEPWGLATADLNNDNFIDIVITNYGSSALNVLLNDGYGNFNRRDTYYIGGTPMSVALADLNNDTFIDIIAANWGDKYVYIFLNKQNGKFQTYQRLTTDSSYATAVTTGDFNRDGKIDIAAVTYDNTLNVFLNQC
ncbi:unnamed protein product [Adineta steineri]|nr:unnamed protein product [Adineta steineri]CAF0807569.1 unnamed protein product [Adineta steineri]CAF0815118.1 unnamed protein product [Adineta steineri]